MIISLITATSDILQGCIVGERGNSSCCLIESGCISRHQVLGYNDRLDTLAINNLPSYHTYISLKKISG